MYGLSVEHTTGDAMVSWTGQNGLVRFYQSELPYDVTQEEYGGDSNTPSAVSYSVDDSVATHDLSGAGVYSFFRDHNVTVDTAFRHPTTTGSGIRMTNLLTRFLNGKGTIRSVVNMKGNPVTERHRMSRVEVST